MVVRPVVATDGRDRAGRLRTGESELGMGGDHQTHRWTVESPRGHGPGGLAQTLTAASSSGRFVARVEIFSEKTRVTPASARESSCASRDCRVVGARA